MDLREIDLGSVDWIRPVFWIGSGGRHLWARWWTFGFLRHGVRF
jgi:hypothetical protein